MLTFRRIVQHGWTNFWRNLWISSATLIVMVLALSMTAGLMMGRSVTDAFVASLEEKVDVSVYFALDTEEKDILTVKNTLEDLSEVHKVNYTSRDDALDLFRERHKDNEVLLESLEELEDNPLQATLSIKATKATYLASITSFLEKSSFTGIIDKIDFRENEKLIDKLLSITSGIRIATILASIVLGIFVIFVTFNTIRLAIYASREEISIMQLVGASNWYIRGPFLVTGALYGIFAAFVTMILFFLMTWIFAPKFSLLFSEVDLFSYFVGNIISIGFILLVIGISLGAISSYIATRRYLKV